ncbi:tetratricopeptide repeat protein [Candidatus Woesebacteria bacterium]|nr:MAG: tetratricopeptide repeat protein [Candidatus Woesebacteria bacterium]
MKNILEKSYLYTAVGLVFLLPIAFSPLSPNPWIPTKLLILVIGVGLMIILKALVTITDGKLTWSIGKFDFPVLLFGFVYLIGAYFKSPSKMEAFLIPGTATAAIGGSLLYFLINQLDKKGKKITTLSLFVSGIVFSLILLIALTGVFASAKGLPTYLQSKYFTPAGGYLPSAIFLFSVLPIGVMLFITEKNIAKKILLGTSSVVVAFAFMASIYRLMPGQQTQLRLPSTKTSWTIAVDSLKESPLMGVGPGNYLTAFNRYRPISFNNTDNWTIKFNTASSYFLTTIAETGMLGVAATILLLFVAIKFVRESISKKHEHLADKEMFGRLISALILLILMLVLPSTELLAVLLFFYLALVTTTSSTGFSLTTHSEVHLMGAAGKSISSRAPAIVLSLPVFIGVGLIFFRSFGLISAEYSFKKSLDFIANNQGVEAYSQLQKTIGQNPYDDRYHARYSQVNLAIANSMAATASQNNGQLSEEDRQRITQLIQQAIREARNTVIINPTRAGNWELLARTYQTIIPLAKGADTFASQSFAQAIALDPYNPNLRLARGGIHYAAGDYANAQQLFELAVRTKPDFANARYNLAFAYKQQNKLTEARTQLTQVMSLVDKNSNDYEVARKALEEIEAQIASKPVAETPPEESQNLVPPAESQEQILVPPVDLNETDAPPEPVVEENQGDASPSITPVLSPTINP